MNDFLKEKLDNVTTSPGVYLWKDIDGNVLYVGKAKNLKKRMSQYFQGRLNSYKTSKLVTQIHDFEVYVVKSEKDALILEKNMIDKYQPHYNVLLLDDKKYPYIKLSLNKKLEISLNRYIKKWNYKDTYFYGPFPNNFGAKYIKKILERELLYENGLQIVNNDKSFWKKQYDRAIDILMLKDKKFLQELSIKMDQFAQNLDFEQSIEYREIIKHFEQLKNKQIVELKNDKNIDVFDFVFADKKIFVSVLFYRYGSLISQNFYTLNYDIVESEIIENFFSDLYSKNEKPDLILASENLENIIDNIDLKIKIPKKGALKEIVSTAHLNNLENIKNYTKKYPLSVEQDSNKKIAVVQKLATLLNIDKINKIILFDNSNLANTNIVGVAVVYLLGVKQPSLYRKINLSKDTVHLNNLSDVEYMYKNVENYLYHNQINSDDLIIVDGSTQQIKAAQRAFKKNNINNYNIIGLVKNSKHQTRAIVTKDYKEIRKMDEQVFLFLKEMQIEVDRYAKSYFNKKHVKMTLEGSLAKIKGIGPKTEQKLLEHFKTYANIYNASAEELEKVVPHNIVELIIHKKEKNTF
ncbi:GIY-YIG nuclease family protein [Mycoplasmopsis ciconiae]|uniref:GIY-YIG nuclease family protein n=1 Tax=Mycoplasmopsis ciconiae TaxID=561067 RepID=A0ABU7MM26_9BACT|nr:GIY-YIG nuclease family protein [Mycoplasmopsis ciconiae]